MKKLLALLLSVILAVTALTSCDILGIDLGFDLNLPDIDMGDSSDGTDDTPDVPDESGVCSHAATVTVGQKSATCTAPGYTGDTVCSSCDAVIVKGIRNEADYRYEQQHALYNRAHNERAETLYLPADARFDAVSSTLVRERLCRGEAIDGLVPPSVAELIKKTGV